MRYHKTRQNKRTTFTYHFRQGPDVTIHPGEEDITEVDIKRLHAYDDAEVYNNIKNAGPKPTAEEKARRKEWENSHPGEKADRNWNLSIYSFTSSGDGDSTADRHAELADPRVHIPFENEEQPDVERLRTVIAGLPPRQQVVYRLVCLEGYSNVDAAKALGISEGAVRKHRKIIIAAIAGDEILQKIFR